VTKRQILTFKYECDGYLRDGRKCIEERRIEASTPEEADGIISRGDYLDIAWNLDHRGWLCMREHRGDRVLQESNGSPRIPGGE
jgi:hypothetical protein